MLAAAGAAADAVASARMLAKIVFRAFMRPLPPVHRNKHTSCMGFLSPEACLK